MEYFSVFGKTTFNNKIITNITKKSDFFNKIKNNIAVYTYKILKETDTPEAIAYHEYGDADLYWVILLFNDIVDPRFDWILSDDIVLQKTKDLYGESNIDDIHHYELNGNWVNQGTPLSVGITNYEYEKSLNEEKRKIKILKKVYIDQMRREFANNMRD